MTTDSTKSVPVHALVRYVAISVVLLAALAAITLIIKDIRTLPPAKGLDMLRDVMRIGLHNIWFRIILSAYLVCGGVASFFLIEPDFIRARLNVFLALFVLLSGLFWFVRSVHPMVVLGVLAVLYLLAGISHLETYRTMLVAYGNDDPLALTVLSAPIAAALVAGLLWCGALITYLDCLRSNGMGVGDWILVGLLGFIVLSSMDMKLARMNFLSVFLNPSG